MRPRGTKQELEIRRRTAVELWKRGLSTREVAKQVGSAPSSVVRWTQMYRQEGAAGLAPKPQAGGKGRLSEKQLEKLRELLIKGPRACGYRNELWTLSRVKALIEKRFGVGYHISHVHRLMHRLGFSHQKPQRQARERDDEAAAWFVKKRWPAVKKKRGGKTRA